MRTASILKTTLRHLLRDLGSQKTRTVLTILGMAWGTLAVSLLLAFGQGLHEGMEKDMRGLGNGIVIAFPMRTSMPFEGMGKGRRIRLKEEDIDLIRGRVQGLLSVSSEYYEELALKHERKTVTAEVIGVSPEFGELRNIIADAGGRFINPPDCTGRRRVIFFGNEAAEEIFPGEDPVGRTVNLGNSPFVVIGVLKPKEQDSNYNGRDERKVFIPGPTLRALTGRETLNNFVFQARDVTGTPSVKKQVLELMAQRHRFDPRDQDAISMWDTTEMFQFMDTFMLAFKLFLAVVGSLTLVVGGIGVSNIMNVVVEERTREIGIKMALGARRRFILGQFLLESLLVSAVGGGVGLLVAYAVCSGVSTLDVTELIGFPTISPGIAGLTAGILGIVGFVAGYFPARTAADLDPVIAMKL